MRYEITDECYFHGTILPLFPAFWRLRNMTEEQYLFDNEILAARILEVTANVSERKVLKSLKEWKLRTEGKLDLYNSKLCHIMWENLGKLRGEISNPQTRLRLMGHQESDLAIFLFDKKGKWTRGGHWFPIGVIWKYIKKELTSLPSARETLECVYAFHLALKWKNQYEDARAHLWNFQLLEEGEVTIFREPDLIDEAFQ